MEYSMNTQYKVGDVFEMVWPFHRPEVVFDGVKTNLSWQGGCKLEVDGPYGIHRSFYANGEGSIFYEVMGMAEMPKRYQNRIIIKRWTKDPDGLLGKDSIETLTESKFLKHINSYTPFIKDYEVEPL